MSYLVTSAHFEIRGQRVQTETEWPHLFLQLVQLVLASMQGLAGEGPVVVGCTHFFTVHHVVVHQALQHVLHSHWSLKQERRERERERGRDREIHRQTERERKRWTDRERERERGERTLSTLKGPLSFIFP